MSPGKDTGRFVWYELMSSDPQSSMKFYEDLLGWTFKGEPVGDRTYYMAQIGEVPFGGVKHLPPGQPAPTHWMAYVAVDDIEATCRKAEQLGGRILVGPVSMGYGSYAVMADPQGAVIAPFQSSQPLTPEPDPLPAGAFCWRECLTSDAEAGAAFYADLFGWQRQQQDMEVGGVASRYHLLLRGEQMVAGSMDLPEPAAAAGAVPHWLYYVMVDDVDAKAEKTRQLGGELLCPPMDIPDVGRFCVVKDPQGGMFALFKGK